MGDRPRDNTKQPAPAPPRTREPGAYYYDDRTGYETYDPSRDEEEEHDEEHDEERRETTGRA